MQFSYATHLAHPVLCRPTHLNISGYASGEDWNWEPLDYMITYYSHNRNNIHNLLISLILLS